MNLSHLYTNPSSHPTWLIPSQYTTKNIGPTFHILILASPWPFSHSSLALSIPAPCVLHFPFHVTLPLLFPVLGKKLRHAEGPPLFLHCLSILHGEFCVTEGAGSHFSHVWADFSCCISEFFHKWCRTCIKITYLWNRCHPDIWHAFTAQKHLF